MNTSEIKIAGNEQDSIDGIIYCTFVKTVVFVGGIVRRQVAENAGSLSAHIKHKHHTKDEYPC